MLDARTRMLDKARPIALYLWRRDLTMTVPWLLPHADRSRETLTRCKLAREAYAENAARYDLDPATLSPPRDPAKTAGPTTWRVVSDLLAVMTDRERSGLEVPARDQVDDAARWLEAAEAARAAKNLDEPRGVDDPGRPTSHAGAATTRPTEEPAWSTPAPPAAATDRTPSSNGATPPVTSSQNAPAAAPSSPSMVTDGPPPPAVARPGPDVNPGVLRARLHVGGPGRLVPVKGWRDLAQLPDLPFGECLNHPGARPVVITPDGGRCWRCPPQPDEVSFHWETRDEQGRLLDAGWRRRDGWGMTLNWAPRPCAGAGRCYCGRHPREALTPAGPTVVDRDAVRSGKRRASLSAYREAQRGA